MRISDWSSDVCSSDLWMRTTAASPPGRATVSAMTMWSYCSHTQRLEQRSGLAIRRFRASAAPTDGVKDAASTSGCCGRSEEHTSELQSLMRISYAVFCLKKKNKNTHTPQQHIRQTNNE